MNPSASRAPGVTLPVLDTTRVTTSSKSASSYTPGIHEGSGGLAWASTGRASPTARTRRARRSRIED
jgi:hypothetical protein